MTSRFILNVASRDLFFACLLTMFLGFSNKSLSQTSGPSQHRPGCVHAEGFRHVDANDWNACTRISYGMRRVPLDDLQHVYLDPILEDLPDDTKSQDSDEIIQAKEEKSPISKSRQRLYQHGHALALVPLHLKYRHHYVLLYLHGYNHQVANGTTLIEPRLEYDRFALQIYQSGHHKDMVALFPQANPDIDFMQTKSNPGFDIDGFLQEASSRLNTHTPFVKEPVVLMAHSAGGRFLNMSLPSLSLGSLRLIVFFDGVNGPVELSQIQNYLQNRLEEHIKKIKSHPSSNEWHQYLKLLPHFYFYYSSQSVYYTKLHKQLIRFFEKTFAENLRSLTKIQAKSFEKMRAYYRMIEVPKEINHSDLMRAGIVERVLKTLPVLKKN